MRARVYFFSFLLGLPIALTLGVFGWPTVLSSIERDRNLVWGIDQELVRNTISSSVSRNFYPQRVLVHHNGYSRKATIRYTIDTQLQKEIISVLQTHRPDYGVFVAVDPDTGRVLAMASHRRNSEIQENLALENTYPSASVFKLVTAAAAIDLGKVNAETVIPFNGKTSSLYRKNVLHHKDNQWTHHFPLRIAFAKSVNTVFGRIGLEHVGGAQLRQYAKKLGFNRIMSGDFQLPESKSTFNPEDTWEVVETAAGYTRKNTLSPVHAALLAASVINGGRTLPPILVDSMTDDNGIVLYESILESSEPVLLSTTAKQLQIMMRETVRSGSAQQSFKGFARGRFKDVEVGGKTGSLSGSRPQGMYDWFVGYARRGEKKIAFAALCINETYWYVKSSQIARKAIENFFLPDQS
jgi:cell division protein FtsI/penicillin-binding protein 2